MTLERSRPQLLTISPDEVAAFTHSVSSIWWRDGAVFVRKDQQSIHIGINEKGARLIYEPETGKWQYCERREGELQCRTTNLDRNWVPYRERDERS